MTEYVIEQKKGFYLITSPAGATAKLTRVTTALDWVLKEAMGAMSYRGGKLFAQYLADDGDSWEEFYDAWKLSEFDPNRQLKVASDRGDQAHKLFEKLLKGEAQYAAEGDIITVGIEGEIPFRPVAWDLGVVQLYRDEFERIPRSAYRSEVRLWWTEHPIDECPEPSGKAGHCTHGFSGTCDVLWPMWGLDDLKTHIPGYRWSEFCQMALYALAVEQMYPGERIHRQRILLAHDFADPETGLNYEVNDQRFLPSSAGRLIWELFKLRKEWGPKS